LVLSDPMEGSDGAILEARRLLEGAPDRYVYLDQYNNPSNWRAHYDSTGPEILTQTHGRITHFVAGIGTSGTLVGVGRRLRRECGVRADVIPWRERVHRVPDHAQHARVLRGERRRVAS